MTTSHATGSPRLIESISVREFYERFRHKLKLELVVGAAGLDNVILEKSVNRPALALTGYFKHFAYKRLQLFGAGEVAYLRDLSEPSQRLIIEEIIQKKVPCIVVSRQLVPPRTLVEATREHDIPLFRTPMKSKDFMAEATVLLEDCFAPRLTIHGTMLDVKGIGTLLRGKSGVGKSECALALIERGHSLVADDHAHIKLVHETELMATSSDLNRGYMECRGIGIINVPELFGIRAIRVEKRIDMIVTFIEWKEGMQEERTGLEQSFFTIHGIDVPHVEIPVRPGRDMARLVEVAAMVQALRTLGHDSAKEFNDRLIAHMTNLKKK